MSSCKIENEFFGKPKTHLPEKEKNKAIEICWISCLFCLFFFIFILAKTIGQDPKRENAIRKQAVRLALPRNGSHDLILKKII